MSIEAYEQHGLQIVRSDRTQVVAECPFCEKDGHFYASREDARYDCKSCQKKGNLYTFLKEIYTLGWERTSLKQYTTLSRDREIPAGPLQRYGIVAHPLLPGSWILPHHNPEGKLANLYLYHPDREKKDRMRGTYDCTQHLFGVPFLLDPDIPRIEPGFKDPDTKPTQFDRRIFLAEGHWDALTASLCLPSEEWSVLGLVGSAFKDNWLSLFEDRDVYVATDNDPVNPKTGTRPGQELQRRVIEILSPVAKSLSFLRWIPDQEPNDIRDLYIKFKTDFADSSPKDALAEFLLERRTKSKRAAGGRKTTTAGSSKNSTPVTKPSRPIIEPLPCKSFPHLLEEFQNAGYSLSDRLEGGIALSFAVHAALHLPGRPLWMFLVGGASTSKTTTIALLADHEKAEPLDHLTGLYSGLKRGNKDAGLIETFNGKTMLFKDWTAILSLSPGEQERILGEFRNVYDGNARTKYRNLVDNEYDQVMFNMVVGTTPRVHVQNRAELGERFIKYDLSKGDTRDVRRSRAVSAVDSFLDQASGISDPTIDTLPMPLRRHAKGFCNHLFETLPPPQKVPKLSEPIKNKIINMASFVAICRTRVERQGGNLLYRPEPEGESRVSQNLTKLLISLCHVLQQRPAACLPVLQEVAFSTAWGFPMEILRSIYRAGHPMTKDQLSTTLRLPATSVYRHLQDMKEIGSIRVEKRSNSSGRQGNRSNLWELSPEMRTLLKGMS